MLSFHSSPRRPGRYSKFSHDAGHEIFQPISKAIEITAKSANATATENTAKAAPKTTDGSFAWSEYDLFGWWPAAGHLPRSTPSSKRVGQLRLSEP